MRLARWLAMLTGLAACARTTAFECIADSECGEGQCEPATGYCSFPDTTCPAGWKYGTHAGNGLAGQCVDPSAGTGDGGSEGDVADDGEGPGTTASADDGVSTDPDTGPPDTTGSPASCAGGTCRAAPPDGWQGPVGVVTGVGSIPACPAELPTTITLGHTMLDAPPATCECGCDPVPGTCPDIDLVLDTSVGDCAAGTSVPVTEGDCVPISLADGVVVAALGQSARGDATCDTYSSTEAPPPAWLDHLRVCSGDASGSCDGGDVCLPSVAGADTCIVQAGDVPCPAGDYSERTVAFGDYIDERDCTACGCSADGPVCHILVRDGATCMGTPDVQWPTTAAACESLLDISAGGEFTATLGTVDNCYGDGGDPTGQATPTDPTTICCVP